MSLLSTVIHLIDYWRPWHYLNIWGKGDESFWSSCYIFYHSHVHLPHFLSIHSSLTCWILFYNRASLRRLFWDWAAGLGWCSGQNLCPALQSCLCRWKDRVFVPEMTEGPGYRTTYHQGQVEPSGAGAFVIREPALIQHILVMMRKVLLSEGRGTQLPAADGVGKPLHAPLLSVRSRFTSSFWMWLSLRKEPGVTGVIHTWCDRHT